MYVVFDIGGTHTRISHSEDGETLLGAPLMLDTPKTWSDAEAFLKEQFSKYNNAKAACGGIPGVFDEAKEVLAWSPNLPDWVGKPVKKVIQEAVKTEVFLHNDAVGVGVGEAVVGAGKGEHIVVYVTVSTGVGGTRIVDGKPDPYRAGSEPGPQILDYHTHETLERLVSGASFARRFGLDFVKTAPPEAWIEAASVLAVGLYNMILLWSPDIVVLGGPMMVKSPGISLALVQEKILALPKVFPRYPKLVLAEHGDASGLYGALSMINNKQRGL